MATITLSLVNKDGDVLGTSTGDTLVHIDTRYSEYQPGDILVLESDQDSVELEVQLDESLPPSVIVLKGGRFEFPIPFCADRDGYPIQAFTGDCHWGYARVLDPRERSNFRNLALNSHDLMDQAAIYPHAVTNTGATNPRFIARNAIDGTFQSIHHGRWPYESWGINGRDDAYLEIQFGRTVHAEQAAIVLRADFPHDSWWQQVRLVCSDGTDITARLEKTGMPQLVDLGGVDIEWIRLCDLVRADDPSPWPGLTQLMVLGHLL